MKSLSFEVDLGVGGTRVSLRLLVGVVKCETGESRSLSCIVYNQHLEPSIAYGLRTVVSSSESSRKLKALPASLPLLRLVPD